MKEIYLIKDLNYSTYYGSDIKSYWTNEISSADWFDTFKQAEEMLFQLDMGYYEIVKIYKVNY